MALRYEYLIRAGHNIGRLAIPAAHADTYRGLERSFISFRDNTDQTKNTELLFQYAFDCGEVVTNISNAIWKFERDFEGKLSQDDKDLLDEIEILLINAKIEKIEEAIEKAEVLFRKFGRIV
ncbi:hypothetical protein ACFFH5_02120 [Epilithonimonas hispanica]